MSIQNYEQFHQYDQKADFSMKYALPMDFSVGGNNSSFNDLSMH